MPDRCPNCGSQVTGGHQLRDGSGIPAMVLEPCGCIDPVTGYVGPIDLPPRPLEDRRRDARKASSGPGWPRKTPPEVSAYRRDGAGREWIQDAGDRWWIQAGGLWYPSFPETMQAGHACPGCGMPVTGSHPSRGGGAVMDPCGCVLRVDYTGATVQRAGKAALSGTGTLSAVAYSSSGVITPGAPQRPRDPSWQEIRKTWLDTGDMSALTAMDQYDPAAMSGDDWLGCDEYDAKRAHVPELALPSRVPLRHRAAIAVLLAVLLAQLLAALIVHGVL